MPFAAWQHSEQHKAVSKVAPRSAAGIEYTSVKWAFNGGKVMSAATKRAWSALTSAIKGDLVIIRRNGYVGFDMRLYACCCASEEVGHFAYCECREPPNCELHCR